MLSRSPVLRNRQLSLESRRPQCTILAPRAALTRIKEADMLDEADLKALVAQVIAGLPPKAAIVRP